MQLAILRQTDFKFPLPQANLVCLSPLACLQVSENERLLGCPAQQKIPLVLDNRTSLLLSSDVRVAFITCLYCWASRVVQYWLYIYVILQINPQVLLTYLQVPCYCILLLLWDSFQYCDNSMPKLQCSSHFEMLHFLSPSPCSLVPAFQSQICL